MQLGNLSRHRSNRRSILSLTLVGALMLAACGGGDDGGGATTAASTMAASSDSASDTAPATTDAAEEPSGSGAVTSFEGAKAAVIQLVRDGTVLQPEGYEWNSATGTGFFISPDGLALTNHHVVTGAATLKIFIGGDTSTSYNATVLGMSECNDLALVRVSGVSDVAYLDWYDGPIDVGLPVYAAGFPLSDPEYTLTRGIVTKAVADNEAYPWASVDRAIEHDANIQPGNSGGPLINDEGKVVAVNYAFARPEQTGQSQYFAIHGALARSLAEQMQERDVEALGINGMPIYDEALGITGIWIRAVEAGSDASRAGLRAGDVITELNGLPMAMDGSYKDYCDVLRTAGDRPISVRAVRYETSEVLRGELRVDQPLEVAFSFGAQVDEQVDVAADQGGGYAAFTTIVDDTGQIMIEVPSQWSDVSTSPVDIGLGEPVPFILASTDISAWETTWNVPGLLLTLIPGYTEIDSALTEFAPSPGECTDAGVVDYEDGKFVGAYRIFVDCGGTSTAFVLLAAVGPTMSGLVVLGAQLVTQADVDVLDWLLATFDAAT